MPAPLDRLALALAAGFPAERIALHGNNKSLTELRLAVDAGIGHVVVDSFDEIERLVPLAAARVAGGGAPVPLLYGTGAVLAGVVYTVLLTMLLPLFAALDRLPPDLLDAAADLGAGPWRRQVLVALPLAAGGIASGVALTFLLCLGVLAAPALLGGAGTPAFASVIAGFFGGASGRWPMGAAFSLVLLAAGTACAGGLAWSVKVGGVRAGPGRLRA